MALTKKSGCNLSPRTKPSTHSASVMKPSAQSDTPNDATFRTQRVLPFPPTRIFEAFARPKQLSQWWGPDGFTNTFDIFEFKPGGRWKFVMRGPDGTNYPNECIFRELHAPSRLVIDHVVTPHFTLTITLTPHETGTTITWNQEFESAAFTARVRHIIEPANEQNMNRLHSVLTAADQKS